MAYPSHLAKSLQTALGIAFLVGGVAACSLFQGRETTGQYFDDATITTKVKEAFVADPHVKASQVSVETMQGVVQLSGFVDSSKSEQKAVSLAQQVNGVRAVKDDIIVRSAP
jgi:hyperosmotically inducible protein